MSQIYFGNESVIHKYRASGSSKGEIRLCAVETDETLELPTDEDKLRSTPIEKTRDLES